MMTLSEVNVNVIPLTAINTQDLISFRKTF
jgi:hypothetical protein